MGGYFCLKDSNNPGDRLALRWVDLPAPFNRLPQTIGKLGVIRSGWSTSHQHGENPCNLALLRERNLPGEDLTVDHSIQ